MPIATNKQDFLDQMAGFLATGLAAGHPQHAITTALQSSLSGWNSNNPSNLITFSEGIGYLTSNYDTSGQPTSPHAQAYVKAQGTGSQLGTGAGGGSNPAPTQSPTAPPGAPPPPPTPGAPPTVDSNAVPLAIDPATGKQIPATPGFGATEQQFNAAAQSGGAIPFDSRTSGALQGLFDAQRANQNAANPNSIGNTMDPAMQNAIFGQRGLLSQTQFLGSAGGLQAPQVSPFFGASNLALADASLQSRQGGRLQQQVQGIQGLQKASLTGALDPTGFNQAANAAGFMLNNRADTSLPFQQQGFNQLNATNPFTGALAQQGMQQFNPNNPLLGNLLGAANQNSTRFDMGSHQGLTNQINQQNVGGDPFLAQTQQLLGQGFNSSQIPFQGQLQNRLNDSFQSGNPLLQGQLDRAQEDALLNANRSSISNFAGAGGNAVNSDARQGVFGREFGRQFGRESGNILANNLAREQGLQLQAQGQRDALLQTGIGAGQNAINQGLQFRGQQAGILGQGQQTALANQQAGLQQQQQRIGALGQQANIFQNFQGNQLQQQAQNNPLLQTAFQDARAGAGQQLQQQQQSIGALQGAGQLQNQQQSQQNQLLGSLQQNALGGRQLGNQMFGTQAGIANNLLNAQLGQQQNLTAFRGQNLNTLNQALPQTFGLQNSLVNQNLGIQQQLAQQRAGTALQDQLAQFDALQRLQSLVLGIGAGGGGTAAPQTQQLQGPSKLATGIQGGLGGFGAAAAIPGVGLPLAGAIGLGTGLLSALG